LALGNRGFGFEDSLWRRRILVPLAYLRMKGDRKEQRRSKKVFASESIVYFFLFLLELGIASKTSGVLRIYSTTELHLLPL
jgi:hypothetical protein